jgi:hypothetical protein
MKKCVSCASLIEISVHAYQKRRSKRAALFLTETFSLEQLGGLFFTSEMGLRTIRNILLRIHGSLKVTT